MARNKVDACFICDQVPCVCGKPASKAAKKSDPKAKPQPEVRTEPAPAPVRKSFVEAMKVQAANPVEPFVPKYVEPKSEPIVPTVSDVDLVTNEAIRNLAPLLHEEELAKYRAIITAPPAPQAALWRARHRLEQEAQQAQ